MHAIHRSRRFGRLLAAWLLLWFVAMSAAPLGPPSALGGSHSAVAVGNDADDEADCGSTGHQHHHDAGAAAQSADARADAPLDVHAGHGAGSLSHCPLCLHGAAPPPVVLAAWTGAEAPAERPAAAPRSVPRTRTDVPPPARGPPARS